MAQRRIRGRIRGRPTTPTHALAIDYALSPVLGALGATRSAGGVYLLDSPIQRGDDGTVQLDKAGDERLRRAVAELAQLVAIG